MTSMSVKPGYAPIMTRTATATIADAKRQATVDVMLAAARQLLLARGLDVTMDDIAVEAGVSRRTLFRHFASRERLIAESLEAGVQLYGELLPSFEGDWRSWLRGVCDAAHEMQALSLIHI